MLFNSVEFLIFFPVVTAGYFLLPHGVRWLWLLAASCLFYMWFIPAYILILGVTILVDYAAGLLIEKSSGARRRLFLGASLAANVGALAFFKYFNFLNTNLEGLARFLGWNYGIENLAIALPVGLSFHTFQAMSYTIEVYRGRFPAERHLGIFAVYVMFYPQLVAGPIERPQNLLPQFRERHAFDEEGVVAGLRLMLWGFFKKMVIADRLAPFVDRVFSDPAAATGPGAVVGTICFAFQIFCDFSAYSDIALGSARVMGFRLMQNFDRPYASASVAEFWRRWHMSLSSWFRDYVYIPLGGNRAGPVRRSLNVIVVFLLSGIWHGANWTFAWWGVLHGSWIVLEGATAGPRRWLASRLLPGRLARAAGVAVTFLFVCFAWIFFRADSIQDAWTLIGRIPEGWGELLAALRSSDVARVEAMVGDLSELRKAAIFLVILEAVHLLGRRESWEARLPRLPLWARWSVYYAFVGLVFVYGIMDRRQFIYFQF